MSVTFLVQSELLMNKGAALAVSVCALYVYTHTHTHKHTGGICVCMCVCVSVCGISLVLPAGLRTASQLIKINK